MEKNNNKYLHRELSWLEFNRRGLGRSKRRDSAVARTGQVPNHLQLQLDKFFMVQVSGIKRQIKPQEINNEQARFVEDFFPPYPLSDPNSARH